MISTQEPIKPFVKFSPVFIQEKATLDEVLELMRDSGIDKLTILKEDFTVVGLISKKEIFKFITSKRKTIDFKQAKIEDVVKSSKGTILIYPGTKVSDAYSLMKTIKMDFLPVVNTPWEKKLVGFLWIKDIIKKIDKDFIRMPV